MLVGKLTGTGSLRGTLSGTGSLRGTLSGGGVGHGIPSGGEPGQGLIKVSDADYDVKWMSILPEDTASGAVASFQDGADDLPMGVVVDIDPVQDLHGYDNPWPGGGGKNLYDKNAVENNKWIDLNATTISAQNGYAVSDFIPVVENQEYYMQAKGSARSAYYDENKNGIEYFTYSGGTSFVAAHTGYVRFTMRNYEALPSLQFEKGSTATAYAPYSNICPISGRTGAKVTRTGRNLLRPKYSGRTHNGITYVVNDNGTITASGTASGSSYAVRNISTERELTSYLPAGTYRLTGGIDASKQLYLGGVYSDGTAFTVAYDRGEGATYTFTKGAWVYPQIVITNGTTINATFNIQLELGSTAHAYEPYTAATHEIPFSTEVYGGKLNVETGELVVTKAYDVLDATRYWIKSSSFPGGYYTTRDFPSGIGKAVTPFICSHAKTATTQSSYLSGTCYCDSFFNFRLMGEDSTLQDWLNYIESQANAGTPIQICYTLATPITLTLTTVEIRSLLGDNNVWSDTGNVSVTYKADIQKYIDKKISAAVAAMS